MADNSGGADRQFSWDEEEDDWADNHSSDSSHVVTRYKRDNTPPDISFNDPMEEEGEGDFSLDSSSGEDEEAAAVDGDVEEDDENETAYTATRKKAKPKLAKSLDPYEFRTGRAPAAQPSLDLRAEPVVPLTQAQAWGYARRRLTYLLAPNERLLGREAEHEALKQHLAKAITNKKGGSIFLYGVPGTGKTATVRLVVAELQKEQQPFNYVEINAMKMMNPKLAFYEMWRQVAGPSSGKVSYAKGESLLKARIFSKTGQSIIVLVDEIDMIGDKNQHILYNLYDWTTKNGSKLFVIGISNTSNLKQSVDSKIDSRMGQHSMAFNPYSRDQLIKILNQRLGISANLIFDGKAPIILIATQVAASVGDARRALQMLQAAMFLAEASKAPKVTNAHVHSVSDEVSDDPVKRYLQSQPIHRKLALYGFVGAMKTVSKQDRKASKKYVTFSQVYGLYERYCAKVNVVPLSGRGGRDQLYDLASAGIIEIDWKDKTLGQQISEAVELETIEAAYTDDPFGKQLLV